MKTPTFSQGDHGMTYERTLKDNTGLSFDLSTVNVRVYIIYDDKLKRTLDSANGGILIKDAANGVIEFELEATDTAEAGNYSMYTEIYSNSFEVSTVMPTTYVVRPKNGGAV